MGGSDDDENYYRRVIYFENYIKYKERASMINPRAFFNSLISRTKNFVYVFGGNNGCEDLNDCECYNFKDNYWFEIASLNIKRNGASCCIFENH
jgi:hypothetical protein